MGSRSPSVQVVQPPPPQFTHPPAPDVLAISRQLAQSRLELDPQMLAQQFALSRQYAPQFAGLEYDVTAQQLPLYRALIERQFPQLPVLAGQVQQQLASPASLTPEHAAAQEAIRERARERLTRGIREAAAVGGTLYGGRRIEEERRGLGELEQAFAAQDIDRIRRQRAQTLSELATLFQLGFPQVQQPGLPQFGQVTPSPDMLLQGMFPYAQPAVVGFGPSARELHMRLLGSIAQGAGQAAPAAAGAAAAAAGCHVAEVLYGVSDLRTLLARLYVATHDSLFLRAYRRWSQPWASWLRRVPLLKPVVRPIWNRMWRAMLWEGW